MEEVLDACQAAYDEKHPLICLDEASRQVLGDVTPPLPMQPGAAQRVDDTSERGEVRSLLMFSEPISGWRRVGCRESRTRTDWALELKHLLEVDYPRGEVVTLVCENLKAHDLSSLYFAFDAETAHRVGLIYAPKNGSWLNMAEMELSLLSRQCLGHRRFARSATMDAEVTAWQSDRHARHCGTNWRFTTSDARVKLKSLYPIPDID